MRKTTERFYPYILGLATPLGVLCMWARGYSPSSTKVEHAFNGTAGFGGIIVGFLATALAVLFAVPDGAAVRFLKRNNGLVLLVGYLEAAILWWLLTALGSMLSLFFLPEIRRSHSLLLVGLVWSYLLGTSVLLFYRASNLIARFMRQIMAPRETSLLD